MKMFKKSLLFAVSAMAILTMTACGGETKPDDSQQGGGSGTDPVTQYTVIFHDKGSVYKTVKVNSGDTVEKPADPKPASTELKFKGWYTAETEGTEWSFLTDVVIKDVDLYSRYESTVEKFDVNFWVKGAVVTTIKVEKGQKIGTQKPADPTLAANEVFDGWFTQETGGELFNFESSITANTNIYAHISQKTNSDKEVYMAVWGRWLTKENSQKLVDGFKAYADKNSIAYTKIGFNYYEGYDEKGAQSTYYGIDSFVTGVTGNVDNDVIFPAGSNVADKFTVKAHALVPYSIPNEKGASDSRYIGSLNDQALTTSLYNWLLGDEAKEILNPKPDTPEEETNEAALYIGYYTQYCNETLQKQVKTAFEAYLKAQSITITTLVYVPFGTDSTSVADVVDLVHTYNTETHQLDVLIGGGNNINSKPGTKSGVTLAGTTQSLTINGGARNMLTFTAAADPVNAKTLYTFLTSEDGQKALTMPEQEPETPTETTANLSILVFRHFFGTAAQDAVENGFKAYLKEQKVTITNLSFKAFDSSTTVGDIVKEVYAKYDAKTPYDVVLGGGGNILSTAETDGTRTLGDKVGEAETDPTVYTKKDDLVISNGSKTSTRNMIYLTSTANSGNVTLLHNYLISDAGKAALATNNPAA